MLGSQPVHMVVVGMLWSSRLSEFSCSRSNEKHLNLASFMEKCFDVLHFVTDKTTVFGMCKYSEHFFIVHQSRLCNTHIHTLIFLSTRSIGMNPLSSKDKNLLLKSSDIEVIVYNVVSLVH